MSVIPLPTPLQTMPLHDLESELLGLAGHIAAAEARFLQLLAEFDERNGWAGDGIRSCAHWLSWRAGMSLRTATERLRVAQALRNLPQIGAAFAAGQISYSKVRAITRITGSDTATLTRLAAEIAAGTSELRHTTVADPETAERVLLNVALHGTAGHVETVVRAVRRRHTPPDNLTARRSVSWRWDEDGSLILRARFTPDEGAVLVAAIEALVPPGLPVTPPVAPSPEDLEQRALEQEPGPAVDRVAARRADALLTLIKGDGDEVVERGTAQVIVHLDASTGTARLEGGPEVPTSTAERLACDARVQVLLNDRTKNRMYLGRNRRLATPAQIAALTVRDGEGCQLPGCTHTRHLHAHHLIPWWFGGRTDVDNLILVCSFHHRLVHDHGYRIRRLSGRWEFLRPDGTPIPEVAVALTGNTESLVEMHTRARLRIDHTTLTPDWDGERLDPDPILDALLLRRVTTAA
ncbi:HNH endonuclease [Pseudonocardia sp. DSM 110487]|uniref:HNH endonuclease signature motif containing protein n=1 Tax=Pseudonocardia sp. DSM 110487 TaxID=2865833 RepID=UPI001C6996F3|nr:HNH endonuclease signature motif containing protein [Pseudonocardia sp. DSM 110487]QYN37097.1 HNH endonuclease [Pseudonocardia sp. DSM 110487]